MRFLIGLRWSRRIFCEFFVLNFGVLFVSPVGLIYCWLFIISVCFILVYSVITSFYFRR